MSKVDFFAYSSTMKIMAVHSFETSVNQVIYSSTRKMEVKTSSETSVNFYGLHNVTSQKRELFFVAAVRIPSTNFQYFSRSGDKLIVSL
jgi:hypothetical protein